MKTTFWIRLMDTLVNIGIALGILLSVLVGVAGMTENYAAVLIIPLGIFASILAAAVAKILLGVAKDIHAIRQTVVHEETD